MIGSLVIWERVVTRETRLRGWQLVLASLTRHLSCTDIARARTRAHLFHDLSLVMVSPFIQARVSTRELSLPRLASRAHLDARDHTRGIIMHEWRLVL